VLPDPSDGNLSEACSQLSSIEVEQPGISLTKQYIQSTKHVFHDNESTTSGSKCSIDRGPPALVAFVGPARNVDRACSIRFGIASQIVEHLRDVHVKEDM
jgi:hypothetical protein